MFKLRLLLATLFLFPLIVNAQSDTTVFFYKYPDLMMDTQENPDFIRMILPPDTSVNKALYVVKDLYPNGKVKMIGSSTSNTSPQLSGPYIEFYPNGKRKATGTYGVVGPSKSTARIGICTEYYSNGKLLSIRDMLDGTKYKLIECRDSSGTVIADNGGGKWIELYEGTAKVKREGTILKGLEDGEWHENYKDSIKYVTNYKKGKLISGIATLPSGKTYNFTEFNSNPTLRKNNTTAFFKNNFRYKDLIQYPTRTLKLSVRFKVDETGKLSDIKAYDSGNPVANEEGERLLKASATEWTPAYQYGIPRASDMVMDLTVTLTKKYTKDDEPEAFDYYVTVFLRSVTFFKL